MKSSWFSIFLPLAAIAALVAVAMHLYKDTRAATTSASPRAAPSIKALDPQISIEAFLAQHWTQPLAPQGPPPTHFSPLEASLSPAACGACHQQQYQAWQESLHAHTMGPGIQWQLQLLPAEQIQSCLNCHAPLAEQRALVAQALDWPTAPSTAAPAYVGDKLADQGLVCAACHVRAHERFGPEPQQAVVALAHDGFTLAPAFSDSRFCASCHQFPESGPRTNGKLREDTLAQWQASAFAKSASPTPCQSCHMPERRHEWKGIHDADITRSALSLRLARTGDELLLAVTNSGAGHHFPTYMVAKITLELRAGERLLAQDIIGWDVDIQLTEERFDTRIPAGATRYLSAALPKDITADTPISVIMKVAPREHYERTFASVLAQRDKLNPLTLATLESAMQEALATRYQVTLLSQDLHRIEPR